MRPHHLGWLLAGCAVLLMAQDAADLPAGKGREETIKICTPCHELATVLGSRRTKIGWQRNVDDMISRGAHGTDQEISAIVAYLTAFYGKINVNTATAKELAHFLGLSDAESQAIVEYRAQNGAYKDFEQLKKTPGVSAEKLQAKRAKIAFSL